jgi:GNAT superfamily N-acetyltransferase
MDLKIISKDTIPKNLLLKYIFETNAKKLNLNLSDFKLIVYHNEKPIGFITGRKGTSKDGKVIILNNLYVSKKYRREGIARRLIYSLTNIARKKKFVGIDFETSLNKTQKLIENEKEIHNKRIENKKKRLVLFRINNNPNSSIDQKIRFVPRIRKDIIRRK